MNYIIGSQLDTRVPGIKQLCSNIERVMQLLRDGEELEEWEEQEVRVDWQQQQLMRDQLSCYARAMRSPTLTFALLCSSPHEKVWSAATDARP
eukprot:1352801-Rhodomonas_salina.1